MSLRINNNELGESRLGAIAEKHFYETLDKGLAEECDYLINWKSQEFWWQFFRLSTTYG
ncbi:hypothetical protein ACFORL_10240 [Legionella dresdenensis]|uniref:Uncharacterized protein n=1 Tax=Legionella dresdenensis TaxID=450200 RepID=A0ABV8CGX8_9GAMM